MKIAYITPAYFNERSYLGGGERYPLNIARGIVQSSEGSASVDLVSYGDYPYEAMLHPGVKLKVLPAAGNRKNPWDMISGDLPSAIADANVVHVHQIFTPSSEVALLVAKQQHKPVCVTDLGGKTSDVGEALGFLELADRIVCLSEFAASTIRTKTPKEIVRGGVDTTFFTPPSSTSPRDRVLYVGRLLPHKGIDRLIAALPPKVPLTVCGRPYHEKYFDLLKTLARNKEVEFITDATDDAVRDFYRRALVTVLSSVYLDCYGHTHRTPELMGLTLLESMACGTPAICSRVAAMPEYIREGENGFVFDNPDQLTEILVRLWKDPSIADLIGTSARKIVEADFSHEAAGKRMLDIYATIVPPLVDSAE